MSKCCILPPIDAIPASTIKPNVRTGRLHFKDSIKLFSLDTDPPYMCWSDHESDLCLLDWTVAGKTL